MRAAAKRSAVEATNESVEATNEAEEAGGTPVLLGLVVILVGDGSGGLLK